eukprot:gene12156-15269_t
MARALSPCATTKETRTVAHLNYHLWPDHGVPDSVQAVLQLSETLRGLLRQSEKGGVSGVSGTDTDSPVCVTLLQLLRQSEKGGVSGTGANSPISVVHCSAGIGRTGAFIAIDIIQRRLLALQASGGEVSNDKLKDSINVLAVVQRLRQQRRGMVQTLEQYQLIYRALITHYESA